MRKLQTKKRYPFDRYNRYLFDRCDRYPFERYRWYPIERYRWYPIERYKWYPLAAIIKHNLKQLDNALEPTLIICIGTIVAFVLIAMYMPMFQLGQTIN